MRPKATRLFSLPVFGEGGVGLFAALAPKEEPHPALPEDGEGK
jgi:hypothetical protein